MNEIMEDNSKVSPVSPVRDVITSVIRKEEDEVDKKTPPLTEAEKQELKRKRQEKWNWLRRNDPEVKLRQQQLKHMRTYKMFDVSAKNGTRPMQPFDYMKM